MVTYILAHLCSERGIHLPLHASSVLILGIELILIPLDCIIVILNNLFIETFLFSYVFFVALHGHLEGIVSKWGAFLQDAWILLWNDIAAVIEGLHCTSRWSLVTDEPVRA